MHSRFVLVLVMIAALFGMAMHAAADVAHAADATHGDCGGTSGGDNNDDGDSSGKGAQHCCSAVCHGWAPVAVASLPFAGLSSRQNVSTETARLASSAGDGLSRPPRQSSEPSF